MRIAVINEISAAAKNADILRALEGRGHELFNLGNTSSEDTLQLQYIHTGLMSALLLHLKAVDFVVGGCGTGLGYLNSVLQYPGIVCGHILSPLDAWLFSRINDGNCISLALNQGYGWAGEINLNMIFDELFTRDSGTGFPAHRSEPQRISRQILNEISSATHKSFAEILLSLPTSVTKPALEYPIFRSVLNDFSNRGHDLSKIIHSFD
ncbi:MAG: RpiB/LacA/LacB family sugar-phosphate isomerase [Anaerolineaceae bacterium]|nr:RpiB/LacA/LacB family sugar-phosphate isomerase [Anaerolineaceae bacterium]